MTPHREIALAVRRALFFGAVTATGASTIPSPALAQAQSDAQTGDEAVQTVTVTGSRIRRVDEETASPVFVIDNAAIRQSGVTTIGELITQLPTVQGAATNPQVNNGGGFGESYVELRGLDAKRTLVLVDGRRLGLIGAPESGTSAVDVNQIPVSAIDHVEILKEGAGAVYGSDAIAGVVNFITRKNMDGVELAGEFGKSSENDGERQSFSVLWGNSGEKFDFLINGEYQKQEEISAANRDFSRFALYLYSGQVQQGGSSRAPTGRLFLPGDNGDGTFVSGSLADQYQCGSVTRAAGASGGALTDYRCWAGAPDRFNYQPYNLLVTPQERGRLFTKFNFEINDNVTAYAEALYNRTRSGYEFAPLPFDATADDVVISAQSIYNPFGIDFGGGSGINPNILVRLLGLGTRHSDSSSDSKAVNFGLRGKLGDGAWEWDLNALYGRIDQTATISGYLFKPLLSNVFGPSFLDANGTPTCGTPSAPLPGCTPVDIFNINDPSQDAALRAISTGYSTDHTHTTKSASLDFTGKVWEMPAGDMQANIGIEYASREGIYTADAAVQALPPLFSSCLLAQEACTGDSRDGYNNKEVYAEVFAPLLKEAPWAHALNVDAGIRFSDYGRFGNTTRGQFKLEYRPGSDLLVRGTFAQVFRAPTIQDIAAAPASTNPPFSDPCEGLTQAAVDANPNLGLACLNVPRTGSFSQANGQISALLLSNPDLKPETGHVTTYGIVYDPGWLPNFSTTVDFWRYTIKDVITQIDPNFSIEQCIVNGTASFCDLVARFPASGGTNDGQIFLFREPTLNLGVLTTNGVDVGFKYTLRNSPLGSFRFSLDATHTQSYKDSPGLGAQPIEIAGQYSRQFGNYAKWRGLLGIGWAWQGLDALLTTRYIDKLDLPNADGAGLATTVHIPSVTYVDLTVGYNLPTHTRIQVGLQNLTDKQPPIFFQNNVINANTDVSTYDSVGRRWWVSFTQKF